VVIDVLVLRDSFVHGAYVNKADLISRRIIFLVRWEVYIVGREEVVNVA
jgi:hypothetical protein